MVIIVFRIIFTGTVMNSRTKKTQNPNKQIGIIYKVNYRILKKK